MYLAHVWRLRYFWLSLVRRDLRTRYRRSVLGMGWSLLHPVLMTVVLCIVFGQVFQTDVRSYGPFLMTGLVVWNFAATVITQGCQSIYAGEAYLRQCPVPLAVFPLRTMLAAGVHLLLGLAVVIMLSWAMQGPANIAALGYLLPAIVMLGAFGWALASLMALVTVLFHDVQHLSEVAIQMLFYLTPVVYPAELLAQRGLDWLGWINPMAVFLELIRQPILSARPAGGPVWLAAVALTLLAASGSALILWRLERRIIFYL